MSTKLKKRTASKKKTSAKKPKASARKQASTQTQPMSAAQLEDAQRQLALLEEIQKRRNNVSPMARAGLDALEAKILTQLHGLQTGKASVANLILSGADWVAKFPGSNATSDLIEPFKSSIEKFIAAVTAAGATVAITSTLRPPQRAYLMHFSWLIARGEISAADVPPHDAVDIRWVHPTDIECKRAAQAMVDAYGMVHIAALTSRHTEARAIDMKVQWSNALVIKNANGATQTIASLPRDGTNAELHLVGATYGVRKLLTDPPHWSEDGH